MFIEGKDGIKARMIYQCKAGAICKTQPSVFKLSEYRFCGIFYLLCNMENGDMAFFQLIHEFNGRSMARPCLKEGIDFIKHIVRWVKDSLTFLWLLCANYCPLFLL